MIKIIGGGPVGSYAAYLLSKKNDVHIYEQKSKVGNPIQCTGILTHTIEEVMKLKKEFIANKVYSTRIYAPNKKHLEVHFKKPDTIIYRDLFDQYLLAKALDSGAKISYNKKYVEKDIVKDRNTKRKERIKYHRLIGADGPLSKVSELHGLGKRKCLMGIQALIRKKNDNFIDFYPYIGTYAWAVPEDEDTMRVGIAASADARRIFERFSRKYKGKILSKQAGMIPLHDPRQEISKGAVNLLGDAAGQIKNTTGGGLVPGLMAAGQLARAVEEDKDYGKLCKQQIGKKLWAHYLARKALDRFETKDWNNLIRMLNKEQVKKVLSEESRDRPISIITKIMVKQPGLIRYARKLF